ncbi:hypothetical protein JW948_03735 [bacterium]|nr:hypothetical protein [bacterium]
MGTSVGRVLSGHNTTISGDFHSGEEKTGKRPRSNGVVTAGSTGSGFSQALLLWYWSG